MTVRSIEFSLPRSVLLLYASLALLLSSTLLLDSFRRGSGEFWWWSLAYLALGLLAVRRPRVAPLASGFLAFLLGWVRTHQGGTNLDLGLGLIALAVGVFVLDRARGERAGRPVDLAGLLLLGIAAWSLVSLVFSVVRIRSFAPAPGFGYRLYQFNAQGFPSEEAIIRTTIAATSIFVWWGLYEYARSLEPRRGVFNAAVFLALAVNAGVLVVQRHVDPNFLHPDDLALIGRFNGVTSFCYALGDAVLAFLLLLPAWAVWRGRLGALTALSLVMLLHAANASGSRTALFTMLLAGLLWAGIGLVRLSRRRPGLAIGSAVAAALVLPLAAVWLYVSTPADLTSPVGRLKTGIQKEGLLGHLAATRLDSYPLAAAVIGEYPLSGVGVGLYLAEVSKQHTLLMPQLELRDPYLLVSYAPNQFLNAGVELGLPVMLALVGVFACAAAGLWCHRRPGGAELAVSLAALAGALQLGPAFYNSEALVFLWMIVGLAARGGFVSGEPVNASSDPRRFGSGTIMALLVGTVVLGVAGHLLSSRSLAVETQWARLRWHLGMGLLPREPGGRWTRPEATFVVATGAPGVKVRWHAGDAYAPSYRAEVSFYVDGVRVERSPAASGRIRESVLPLPAVPGRKRISVRVAPPFVPAATSGGTDRRHLGIFIHSVIPTGATTEGETLP